jgi:hypothetical protein
MSATVNNFNGQNGTAAAAPAATAADTQRFYDALKRQGEADAAYLAKLNAGRTLYQGVTGNGQCLPG